MDSPVNQCTKIFALAAKTKIIKKLHNKFGGYDALRFGNFKDNHSCVRGEDVQILSNDNSLPLFSFYFDYTKDSWGKYFIDQNGKVILFSRCYDTLVEIPDGDYNNADVYSFKGNVTMEIVVNEDGQDVLDVCLCSFHENPELNFRI